MHPRTARYLVQFACFGCQKSFKRASKGDVLTCPNCGGEAVEMGRNFRAPKSTDPDQWQKIRILFDGGVRFWGTQSLGRFPDTCAEAIEFVKRNRSELDRQERNYRKHLAEQTDRDLKMREKGRLLREKRKVEFCPTAQKTSDT